MKNVSCFRKVTILSISVMLLTACGALDRISSLRNDPVMKVQHGMSKSQVEQIVGVPSAEHSLQQPAGTCLEYITYTQKSGAPVNHVIMLNKSDQVIDIYTGSTCRSYAAKKAKE
ncbi:outer membrane protein assembly factor BamE [Enterobacter hormaechei]|nr:outer membrane protein assembly factor BamE [Enterobacter hormaechei]